jgi:aspartyl-tRNA(Asn)/glutamyl-tRNA(Gln) amidotransferase subunit A
MTARIPDWSTLDPAGRHRQWSTARTRARALNPLLNAFAEISAEPAALARAGLLSGIPFAAKDMFRTSSHQPCCGFTDSRGIAIAESSEILAGFEAAGADLIGFTNMTELAYEPSGFNASRGRVRNPWDLDCISGGSSSGSAAAVASGVVVAALGSDTGGSLRIPAHACGVTAWKPTHGLVSSRGAMALAPSLDTIGLLARDAADMMPFVPVMAELPASEKITHATVLEDVVAECDPAIRRAIADVSAVLAGHGIAIEQRPALAAIEAIDRHALIVMQGESARLHRARLNDTAIAPVLRRRLAKGLEVANTALTESIAARAGLVCDFEERVLAGNDVAVLPVMSILTPDAAECDPDSDRFSPRTLYSLSRLTRFVNMLGFPAVAFPAGFDHRGMPIGVQIMGRSGTDLALLDLVRQVQSRTDWHARIPTAIGDLMCKLELQS